MDTDNAGDRASLRTMAQLLGGGFYPVIPDMQRDYCWGLEKVTSPIEMHKCTLFVDGLIYLYKSSVSGGPRHMSIGLLYGYEHPKGSGAINIIDGQQRLTTLYLLMGMMYRRIPDTEIGHAYRAYLVSETADGDVTPRLQYQSKSEAMYFLTDLVSEFFLSRSGRLSQIEQSKWYFKSYDADTNARAFLGAIRSIDASIEKEIRQNPDFDFEGFATFLVDDVTFRYFDMGSRSVAERAFITINTTGHPLTLAQNLRALAIGLVPTEQALVVAELWNGMEDWFWRHRPLSMDAFLHLAIRLASQSEDGDDAAREFLSEDLPRVFAAYARCAGCGVDVTNEFAILPMLRYLLRFGDRARDCDIDRLGHLLCNYARYQKTGAADRQQAMELVSQMPRPDVLSALDMRHLPTKIINEEEKTKLLLLRDFNFDSGLQSLMRRGEEHPMLRGRIAKVISWCREKNGQAGGAAGGARTGKFVVSKFGYYIDRIYEIWGTEIDRRDDLDAVRRALLTLRHRSYPIVRRGDMVLSLCWKDYDWQRLMIDSPEIVRQLIDRTANMSLEEMSKGFGDIEYPYYFIISDRKVLDGCRKRQLLRPCEPFIGIYYLQANRTQWWIEGLKLHIDYEQWSPAKPHGQTSLVIDHLIFNATIGLVHTEGGRCRFRVELFRRTDSSKDKVDLKEVVDSLRYPMRYDRASRRFVMPCVDAAHALKCVEEIIMAFVCD